MPIHVCMFSLLTYMCVCVCVCMYIYVCVCMCVYMYVCIYSMLKTKVTDKPRVG